MDTAFLLSPIQSISEFFKTNNNVVVIDNFCNRLDCQVVIA